MYAHISKAPIYIKYSDTASDMKGDCPTKTVVAKKKF